MAFSFSYKRALVTGAGKGIGRGIALRLANLGAKVYAISRTQEDIDSLIKEMPEIEAFNVDIADWTKTKKIVENIGPIELLVNNAGVTYPTPFLDVTKELLDNEFDINYKAAFNITQVVAKGIVERGQSGSVVNISSIAGLRIGPSLSSYCSAKAALDMLTKTTALELGSHNIRVNSVNPSMVMTPMALKHCSTEEQQYFKSRTPLQRLANVEDIVNTTLFLLSDHASMINGIVMPVDGGIINRI